MSTSPIERTAAHEAGHVTMAYYFRRRCNYTECSPSNPGEGRTQIIWRPDHEYVNMLSNPGLFRLEIQALSQVHKEPLMDLFNHFLLITCAGTAAEVLYDEDNSRQGPTIINGADGDAIGDFIEGLSLLNIIIDTKMVQTAFEVALRFLKEGQNRRAVKELTNALLTNGSHKLGQHEIEAVLARIGFVQL